MISEYEETLKVLGTVEMHMILLAQVITGEPSKSTLPPGSAEIIRSEAMYTSQFFPTTQDGLTKTVPSTLIPTIIAGYRRK